MAQDDEHERIARKAHELWESEGHPHGRDQLHWDEAKEIIALEDSMDATLLPRETGASEPEEPALAVNSQGDMPNLRDQGADDLTSTDREPAITKPAGRSGPAVDMPAKEVASTASMASPVGNSAPVGVTGKTTPKDAAATSSVTQGKPGAKT